RDPADHQALRVSRQNTWGPCGARLDRRRRVGSLGHWSLLTQELKLPLADREVTAIEHFGHNIDAVVVVKIDKVRLAVLDLVESRRLLRARLDIGEVVVVVHRSDVE